MNKEQTNPFLRIKMQQKQQKACNLFVDANCESAMPIAILG